MDVEKGMRWEYCKNSENQCKNSEKIMEKISASGYNISGKEVDYYDSGYINK